MFSFVYVFWIECIVKTHPCELAALQEVYGLIARSKQLSLIKHDLAGANFFICSEVKVKKKTSCLLPWEKDRTYNLLGPCICQNLLAPTLPTLLIQKKKKKERGQHSNSAHFFVTFLLHFWFFSVTCICFCCLFVALLWHLNFDAFLLWFHPCSPLIFDAISTLFSGWFLDL